MKTIVVATPHKRNDSLVQQLVRRLVDHRIVRIIDQEKLNFGDLAELEPQWVFFPHWSWIIPKEIHSRYKCVIFHMTDLPYGRGGSPLQNLIVRGHKNTKLTAIKCVAELDAGPVYSKVPLSLDGTAEEILQRAAGLMEDLIVEIVENDPTPVPQTGEIVEFKRRRPEDGNIESLVSLEQSYDYIRMLDAESYPHAFLQTPHLRYEFSQAHLEGDYVEAKVRIRRRIDE